MCTLVIDIFLGFFFLFVFAFAYVSFTYSIESNPSLADPHLGILDHQGLPVNKCTTFYPYLVDRQPFADSDH